VPAAGLASSAERASDAAALGGLGPAAFERSADQDAVIRVRNLTPGSILDIHTDDTGGSGAKTSILVPATQYFDTMQLSRAGSSAGLMDVRLRHGDGSCFGVRVGP